LQQTCRCFPLLRMRNLWKHPCSVSASSTSYVYAWSFVLPLAFCCNCPQYGCGCL
jgi:hypothetical protein